MGLASRILDYVTHKSGVNPKGESVIHPVSPREANHPEFLDETVLEQGSTPAEPKEKGPHWRPGRYEEDVPIPD